MVRSKIGRRFTGRSKNRWKSQVKMNEVIPIYRSQKDIKSGECLLNEIFRFTISEN